MYRYSHAPLGQDMLTVDDIVAMQKRSLKPESAFSLTGGFMPIVLGFGAIVAVGLVYKTVKKRKGKRK